MIDLGFGLWPTAISHLFLAAFLLSVLFGVVVRHTAFACKKALWMIMSFRILMCGKTPAGAAFELLVLTPAHKLHTSPPYNY